MVRSCEICYQSFWNLFIYMDFILVKVKCMQLQSKNLSTYSISFVHFENLHEKLPNWNLTQLYTPYFSIEPICRAGSFHVLHLLRQVESAIQIWSNFQRSTIDLVSLLFLKITTLFFRQKFIGSWIVSSFFSHSLNFNNPNFWSLKLHYPCSPWWWTLRCYQCNQFAFRSLWIYSVLKLLGKSL